MMTKCNHSHAHDNLYIHATLKTDPSRTTNIRNAFVREVNKRFRRLKGLIRDALIEKDVFGLITKQNIFTLEVNLDSKLPHKAFVFKTDPEKATAFMDWWQNEVDQELFDGPRRKVVASELWANKYTQTAYKKGLERANTELEKLGMGQPDFNVDAKFLQPIHLDKVGLIYTRTYGELKGVADRLDQRVSRVLAQGIADGKSPYVMARELNKEVDLEMKYARTLARTETIRAHHAANINVYREAGLEGVKVKAEWATAGFDVCPFCEELEGKIFTLDEISGLIPYHPNCRCVALPIVTKPKTIPEEPYLPGWEKAVIPVKKKTILPLPPVKKKPSQSWRVRLKKVKEEDFASLCHEVGLLVNKGRLDFYSFETLAQKREALKLLLNEYEHVMKQLPSGLKIPPLRELGIVNKRNLNPVYTAGRISKRYSRCTGLYYPSPRMAHTRMFISHSDKGSWKWAPRKTLTLGNFLVGNGPRDTFRHEFGHYVYDYLNYVGVKWRRPHISLSKVASKLSQYATVKRSEYFAELFSAYFNNTPTQVKLPMEMKSMMESVLKKLDKRKALPLSARKIEEMAGKFRLPQAEALKSVKSVSMARYDGLDPKKDYVRALDGKWYRKGKLVTSEEELSYLKKIGVPPAWTDVIVSYDKNARVLAKGIDSAGRSQARYSAKHTQESTKKKFLRIQSFSKDKKMIDFGVEQGIQNNDPRAMLLHIEDRTVIRVGSRKDVKAKKQAYGLTTLQARHVKLADNNRLLLNFTAKEGIKASYDAQVDPRVYKFVADRLKKAKSPTDYLFPDVPNYRLNKYIKELSGKQYTIKDYRTYHATRIAYEMLKEFKGMSFSKKEKAKIVKGVIEKVSSFLHNTPKMAEKSYIDPIVWDLIGGAK